MQHTKSTQEREREKEKYKVKEGEGEESARQGAGKYDEHESMKLVHCKQKQLNCELF